MGVCLFCWSLCLCMLEHCLLPYRRLFATSSIDPLQGEVKGHIASWVGGRVKNDIRLHCIIKDYDI